MSYNHRSITSIAAATPISGFTKTVSLDNKKHISNNTDIKFDDEKTESTNAYMKTGMNIPQIEVFPTFRQRNNALPIQIGISAHYGGQALNIMNAFKDLLNGLHNKGYQYKNNSLASRGGYMSEVWHTGTYNLDAACKNIWDRARMPCSTQKNSPDIIIGNRASAQCKYYRNAYETAKQQLNPGYKNQLRIVPADQCVDCIKAADRIIKINEAKGRTEVAKAQRDARDLLTDRFTYNGAESTPISKGSIDNMARIDCNKPGAKKLFESTPEMDKQKLKANKAIINRIAFTCAIGFGIGVGIEVIKLILQNIPSSMKLSDIDLKGIFTNIDNLKRMVGGGVGMAAPMGIGELLMIKTPLGKKMVDMMVKKGLSREFASKMSSAIIIAGVMLAISTVVEFMRLKRQGNGIGRSLIGAGETLASGLIMTGLTLGIGLAAKDMLFGTIVGSIVIVLYGVAKAAYEYIKNKKLSERLTDKLIEVSKPCFA